MLDEQQQTSETPSSTGLVVFLEVAEPVVVGLSVLTTIYIINRGNEPVTVSSRLNLMEGDVRFLIADAGGNRQKVSGAGGQPDTALQIVTLPPGKQIAASINILNTSIGETFKEPGRYTVQALYYPGGYSEPLSSNTVSIAARMPQTESEKQVASILQNEAVKLALTLTEDTGAAPELQDLATRFSETRDGQLAALLLAASEHSVAADAAEKISPFSSNDPVSTAFNITALTTPYSNVGERLKNAFGDYLNSVSTSDSKTADDDSAQLTRALKIVGRQPFDQ
jgi:hypothetical protein